jgi:hypothetical protein
MTRRWALVVGAALSVGLAACSSSSTSGVPSTVAATGCHTRGAAVGLALSDRQPIPVVRTVPGGCVAVSVPRSPFQGFATEVPRVSPGGRLHLVSETVLASGVRTAYYRVVRTGTVTVSSTVKIHTDVAVPEWSGLVLIV